MFEATGGLNNTYRLLLGPKVMKTMVEKIGEDNANKFLKLHAKYDALVRKNPKADPMQAMPAEDIPVFADFDNYVMFLKRIDNTLKTMREPISKAMCQVITMMIQISEAKPAGKTEATAAVGTTLRYGKTILRSHNMPSVPAWMRDSKNLPYSYPSWDATMDMIQKLVDEKGFKDRIESELTENLKANLVKVLADLPKTEHKTIKELVVEAQEYLMDHNWICYGLENVARASYNIASAGVKHNISTDGVIKHIANTRTLAYAFLGANLEMVLRKACYSILKEASSNMVFAGKNASLDVLTACSSYYVQELGRNWLDNLQSKLK